MLVARCLPLFSKVPYGPLLRLLRTSLTIRVPEMPHVIILGTLDTKLGELLYLRARILEHAVRRGPPITITLIDCGRNPVQHADISISLPELLKRNGDPLSNLSRGEAIERLTELAISKVKNLIDKGNVDAIISAGGSGGTSLACAAMREAAPIGMPKLMVSTVASGDTAPYVGESDITMMYSVVDIAGSNNLLRTILANAASAIAAMAYTHESQKQSSVADPTRKTRVGLTMFGVTTLGADKIREHLERNYPVEVFVFHATGHGGKAMERLIREDQLDAVLDLTTTEICDHLMGGNMSAGPHRLDAALKKGIPYIISLGATDMVNFGPIATVPTHFRDRKLYEHNSSVTLMRTTREECSRVGRFIVEKIKVLAKYPKNVEVWIPKGGVSLISTHGGAFQDFDADAATAEEIRKGLQDTNVRVCSDDESINGEGFAVRIAEALMRKLGSPAQLSV